MLLACVIGIAVHAQVEGQAQRQSKPSVASESQPTSLSGSDAKVPLLDHPLSLSDFPNMEPKEELKHKLGHLSHFIQNAPVDGAVATQSTEVYLGRTSNAFYIVFLCYDQHPELIRTHLARRENI